MPNVTHLPRMNNKQQKVTIDVLDELIKQTYPNPIIHDLYWIIELIQRVRSDVVNVDTWFEEELDDVCYFQLDLDYGDSVIVRCEGVESIGEHSDGVGYLMNRYIPKDNSCFESIKLQVSQAAHPRTWVEVGNAIHFNFPHHDTRISVSLKELSSC